MLLLELLEDIQLLLFVTGGLASLFLPLVVHHLLHHAAGLAVQVAQLAVLGLDLAGIDLGRGRNDMRPPLHLVLLVQVNLDVLAGRCWCEGPCGLVDANGVGKLAL